MKSIFLLTLLLNSLLFPQTNQMRLPTDKTYAELEAFLSSDKTNELEFTDAFDCVEFSETLIENGRKSGFLATGYIVVWQNDPDTHEIVAFQTSDNGIVMVEPQDDTEYIIINNELCDNNGYCWDGGKIQEILTTYNQDFQHMTPVSLP